MRTLLLVSMLALVAGQADAAKPAKPWYFNGGQWTCEIDGEKTKLFVRFDNARDGDDSTATLVDPPYYQKTKFRPIRVIKISGEKVTFAFNEVRVHLFKDINGTARGTIMREGQKVRVDCTRA
jgi:hypothetical protein